MRKCDVCEGDASYTWFELEIDLCGNCADKIRTGRLKSIPQQGQLRVPSAPR